MSRTCRTCNTPFEPEAFEVYCSPTCTVTGNSGRPELRTKFVEGAQVRAPAPRQTFADEAAFQAWLNGLARSLGWLVYHTRDSRRSEPGFLDTVLLRETPDAARLLVAELKMEGNKPTPAQRQWLRLFERAGAEVYTWWPEHMPDIIKVLT